MKKIISFALAVMFGICAVALPQTNAAAETETTYNAEHIAFFKAFSVFPQLEELDKTFTRGEMAAVITNILNWPEGTISLEADRNITDIDTCAYADAVKTVVRYGIMAGYDMPDGTVMFRPEDPIATQDVIKVLVNLLEYGPLAEANGGYPLGYLAVASNIHLLGNADVAETTSVGNVVSLVYKALHTKLPNFSTNAGGLVLNSNFHTNTYIEEYWNVTWNEGVLQGNTFLSIDGLAPTDAGRVRIADETYRSALLFENAEYLGQTVRFYVENEEEEQSDILCMYPLSQRNRKLTVNAGDVMQIDKGGKITVMEGNKKATYNVSFTAAVYDNYSYLGPIDAADTAKLSDILKQGNTADMVLVDNNGDETIDFVWVRHYENVVVKEFLYPDFKITGKYGERLKLKEAYEQNKMFLWDENGELFNPKDIEKNVVLSLVTQYDSAGEAEKVFGFASAMQVNGTVREISEEGVSINGVNYLQTKEYLVQVEAYNRNVKELEIGMDTTFLLNRFNQIAAINVDEINEEIETQIGFISKFAKGNGLSNIVECILYGTDGTPTKMRFAEKVTINGKTVSGSGVYNTLQSYEQQTGLLYRLVKYKLRDEQIADVDIYAYDTKESGTDSPRSDDLYPKLFIRSNEATARTVFKSGTIGKRVGLSGNTKIFAVPAVERKTDGGELPDLSGMEDEAIYALSFSNLIYDNVFGEPSLPANTGASAASNKMQMAFYDVDETMFADIAIRYYEYNVGDSANPDTPGLNTNVLVVEKITDGVNEDGERVSVLHGFRGGASVRMLTRPIESADSRWSKYPALKYYLQTADGTKTAAADIQPGDAVLITTNTDDEITNMLVTVRAGNKENESWLINEAPKGMSTLNAGQGNQYLGVNYGTVKAYADSKIVLAELDGTDRVYSLDSVTVTVYDREEKTVYKGALTDIEVGDDVYIRQYYSNIKEVVLYK